jgi:hypothetical protein
LLEIIFGHHILNIYLRHLFTKVWILRWVSFVTSLWVKVKDEFVPARWTKECRQVELITGTIILNFATRWGSGQFSIHRPLCPEETALGYTLIGGLCGGTDSSWTLFENREGSNPWRESKHEISDVHFLAQSLYWMRYIRFY